MIILDQEKFEPLLQTFQIEMSAQTTLLGQILAVNMEMFSSYQERIQDVARTEELQKATEPAAPNIPAPVSSPTAPTLNPKTDSKDGLGLGLLNASALKDILFGDKSLFGAVGIGSFLGKSVKSLGSAFLLTLALTMSKEFVEGMFQIDIDEAISNYTNDMVSLDWRDATSLAIGKVVGGPIGAVAGLVSQNLTEAFEGLSGINISPEAELAIAGITSILAGNKNITTLLMRVINPYAALVAAVATASVLAWKKFDEISAELDKQDLDLAQKALNSNDLDTMVSAQKILKTSDTRMFTSEQTPQIQEVSRKLEEAIVKKQATETGLTTRINTQETSTMTVVDKEKDMNIVRQAAIQRINSATTDKEVIEVLREAGMYAVKYGLDPSEALSQIPYAPQIKPEKRGFVQEVFGHRGSSKRVDDATMQFLGEGRIGDERVIEKTVDNFGWWADEFAINPEALSAAEQQFGSTSANLLGLSESSISNTTNILGSASSNAVPRRSAAAVESATSSTSQVIISNSNNTNITNASTSNVNARGSGGGRGSGGLSQTVSPDKSTLQYNMGR